MWECQGIRDRDSYWFLRPECKVCRREVGGMDSLGSDSV